MRHDAHHEHYHDLATHHNSMLQDTYHDKDCALHDNDMRHDKYYDKDRASHDNDMRHETYHDKDRATHDNRHDTHYDIHAIFLLRTSNFFPKFEVQGLKSKV